MAMGRRRGEGSEGGCDLRLGIIDPTLPASLSISTDDTDVNQGKNSGRPGGWGFDGGFEVAEVEGRGAGWSESKEQLGM